MYPEDKIKYFDLTTHMGHTYSLFIYLYHIICIHVHICIFKIGTCCTGTETRRPPVSWPSTSCSSGRPEAQSADRRCRVCPRPRNLCSEFRPLRRCYRGYIQQRHRTYLNFIGPTINTVPVFFVHTDRLYITTTIARCVMHSVKIQFACEQVISLIMCTARLCCGRIVHKSRGYIHNK